MSELDISGNLLQEEVAGLRQLAFLKKLNLANNQIPQMWKLPHTLEILNMSYNSLTELNSEVTASLKNLSTLDLSYNQISNLKGVETMTRLKRLVLKSNKVSDITIIQDNTTLIELDLEKNPFDSYVDILQVFQNKKDILVLSLKGTPLAQDIQSYDNFIANLTAAALSSSPSSLGKDKPSKSLENIEKKLKYYWQGVVYRSKRVFNRLKQVLQNSKRSSNFSNCSGSNNTPKI